jgi:uncharacterized delta-60 repeat protein
MKKSIFTIVAVLGIGTSFLFAQNGALDLTFSSNATGCFNPVSEAIMAHIVLDDNSILCASYDKNPFNNLYQGSISKFTAEGNYELSFGPNADGSVQIADINNLFLSNLAVGNDGSIFSCSFDALNATGGRIDKLTPGGLPVLSFGVNGVLELPDFAPDSLINGMGIIEIDNQDRILVTIGVTLTASNTSTTCLARLLPDGSPDVTFGNAGFYFLPFPNCRIAQIIESDNSIILAGSVITGTGSTAVFSTYCLKINSSGQLITSFGSNGITELSPGIYKRCTAANLMPNGSIALLYYFPVGQLYNTSITLLNGDGSINTGYANNGTFTLNIGASTLAIAEDMDVLPDGSILAAGYTIYSANTAPGRNVLLFKLNPSGTLDTGFGLDGVINEDYAGGDDAYANIAFQSDYKLILTGNWSFQDFVQSPSDALTSSLCRRNLAFSDPTGILSQTINTPLLFPNPINSGDQQLHFKNLEADASVQIMTCDGRILGEYDLYAGQKTLALAQTLATGMYLIKISSNGKSETQKLMVR